MKNLMKKIVVSIVGLSMVLMMAPGIAQGATIEELEDQIADLLAQIESLQTQLTALTGEGVGVSCTFTRNLYPGMSGADVKCLQEYLNDAGYTLASSGAGSPGNETEYFGPLTQAAVGAWQDANGVVYGAWKGYFGPISQAKYTALAAVGEEEEEEEEEEAVAAEGSIVATIASTPTGVEVYTSVTDKAVAAVEVKASGSDVLVNRFDVNFSKRPWLYITNLTITDGTTSKTIAVTEENTTEITIGSSYTVRVGDLGINIPKDTTKTLTIKVDAVSSLPGTETSTAVVVTIGANAIRGTDGVGIQQYAPTEALSTRTFTVTSGDTANIEITAHADNPKARNLVVQSTGETTGVVLAKINVKATNKDAILRTVGVFENAEASSTIKTLYLYDGDTLLSSTSSIVTVATSSLANVNLTIPKDTTKVLTVKADINKAKGNYITADATALSGLASSSISVEASVDGFFAEDATTFATATVSGSNVVPGGAYFFVKAPSLTLNSVSIASVSVATASLTYNGKADARIKINVTAEGGDIYVASTTANDVTATTTLNSTSASTTIVESISTNAADSDGGNWVVRSGETKYFEFYAQITGADWGATDAATYVYLTVIKWASTDAGAAAGYNGQTWAMTDFKTTSVVIEYVR